MEDYGVAETRKIDEHDIIGVFAIFDGYVSHKISAYLQSHLFNNIITEPDFLFDTVNAVKGAYLLTDTSIMEESKKLYLGASLGGSTAVTAILLNNHTQLKLVVGNVGDSRAVICCKNAVAKQLSVDHLPNMRTEREAIERRGGYVSGEIDPRVQGMLPITRAFGVSALKTYISCEPDVAVETIDDDVEFLVLASRPLWMVMSNQQVVDFIKQINNAQEAAELLIMQALSMKSYCLYNDISCVVVRFR